MPEQEPLPRPEEARYELQAVLGQIHGLLDTATEQNWVSEELRGPIRAAYPGISQAFGQVQAELNTDAYDEALIARGLTGEQMEPKKLGFRGALRQFLLSLRPGSSNLATDLGRNAGNLGDALQWAGVIVGSLATELNKVKGMEILKEGIEVIQVATAQWAAKQPPGDHPAPRRPRRESGPASE